MPIGVKKKMPNWCGSSISVKGKPKDIENFCKLFVWEEETDKENKKTPYFARSFTNVKWKDFKKKIKGKKEVDFLVDFAGSCWSCIFEGYPDKKKGFVTLDWACKKYDVEVEIETEEGGEGFEEKIIGDKNNINYECVEMPTYECACGNKEMIGSNYDVEEYECSECGKTGKWGDNLKKILEKRIENGHKKGSN